MKWFVMIRGQMSDDAPMPLVEDDESVALFDSETEADNAASRNPLAVAFGWEGYKWKP